MLGAETKRPLLADQRHSASEAEGTLSVRFGVWARPALTLCLSPRLSYHSYVSTVADPRSFHWTGSRDNQCGSGLRET